MKSKAKERSVTIKPLVSQNPRVQNLQGIDKAISHFETKGLGFRHLRLFLAVEQFISHYEGRMFPRADHLGEMTGIHPDDFEIVLEELVEKRYLHKMHAIYGNLTYSFKIGAVGGSLLRQMGSSSNGKTNKS